MMVDERQASSTYMVVRCAQKLFSAN